MPKFSYVATGPTGESVRGTLEAVNKTELSKRLRSKNLFLVSCESENTPPPATADPRTQGRSPAVHRPSESISNSFSHLLNRAKNAGPLVTPRGKVALKELVIFTRQISISINAGMSFVEALQSLAANARNPRMAWVLRRVLEDVLSGKKFSDALSNHPTVFKPVFVSMTAAGEAGGFMPEALNRAAEFLEKEIELRSKIKSAMVYPAFIAGVATLIIIGMMTFVVPTFAKVFIEMGVPLPFPTRLLIAASNFTCKGGFLTPFIVVGVFFYLKRFREHNEHFRAIYDRQILGLPLFGRLITLGIITRFIRTLASLVANGVMALQAISVSRQVVENRTIEKVVDEIFSSVQQGNGISPVLYRSKYFPVLVANMVSTGEKTGSIPEVLNKMADYYDTEVSSAIQDLLTVMEPLMIVVMAVIVGFVIAGLMLPTFQLSSLVG
ncbi:MAG: type II secretion system F family protein [Elusimicrobiota bacterium]|jgi:type IV pilus assembly protein PilC